MLAKNLMGLGKLFLILAVSANAHGQTWTQPLNTDYVYNGGFVGFIYNASKWYGSRLSKGDQTYHSQAVYHALDNADNGEAVEWYNDYEGSMGKVMIAASWPANGDICRRMHHYIRTKSDSKSWGDTACMSSNTRRWVFTDK